MAVAAEALVRDKLYIGGEWVEPAGDGTIEVVNPSTEEVIGRIPEGTPEDADRAVRAARAAFDSWSSTTPDERVELLAAVGRQAERARRRARRADRHRDGHAAEAHADDPGRAAHGELLADPAAGPGGHLGGEGRQLADRARARRRGGGHHAVELPAPPDRRQGRAGARRGLHRRAEAERGRAAQRLRARRDPRGGRPARGRVQPRDRHRAGGGRGDRGAPRDGHGLVHGLDPRRASACRSWRRRA